MTNQFDTIPVFIKCKECKKLFRVSPSKIDTKFCNRSCYGDSVKGIPFYGVTHGMSNKCRAYGIWKGMRKRCNNSNEPAYPNYGGRGITVCERWNSFINFFNDMGEPEKDLSIDRIDNDRGYFKENCRWATRTQQANNRRKRRTNAITQ